MIAVHVDGVHVVPLVDPVAVHADQVMVLVDHLPAALVDLEIAVLMDLVMVKADQVIALVDLVAMVPVVEVMEEAIKTMVPLAHMMGMMDAVHVLQSVIPALLSNPVHLAIHLAVNQHSVNLVHPLDALVAAANKVDNQIL
jgi:hypothetical protein